MHSDLGPLATLTQWWVSVNLNLNRCFYEFGVNELAITIEK